MKERLLAGFGLVMMAMSTAQAELKWLTDFEEGKKAAADSGKTLLVDFTGSDWCHWCIQLKKEVFSQEAFEAAAEKYVLVELDFPEAEGIVTPEQRAKNEALAQKLQLQGFPSVLLFDEKGRAVARTGYQEGGPEAYLKHLDEIAKPYQDLKAAEGEDRKEALVTFLETLAGVEIEETFGEELAELKKLDPEDESGLVKEMATAKAMFEFETGIEESLAGGEFENVFKLVDDFLAEHNPQGEQRQHVLMGKVMAYVEQSDTDKAFALLDEMAALAPESELSQNVEEIKKSITEHVEMRAEMEKEAGNAEEAPPADPSMVEEPETAEKEEKTTVNPEAVVE